MPAAGAWSATRSAKLPPSEKPPISSGRSPKRSATWRTAPTTSSIRHEWNKSLFR